MSDEAKKKAASDPYIQGLLSGQRDVEEKRNASARHRGFMMGTRGTGFDR